ncbi:MAG: putative integral rane protein [Actinomycetia bacterium]|nr:putative integral rane protein [Actinomycetes bacterium]
MTDTRSAEQGAEVAGRVGLVSRGIVYCLLAVVAAQVAAGQRGQEVDRQGALRALARQPFGRVLLAALTVGFAAYALWRFAEAALGDDDPPKRLLHAARGVLYAAFTVTSARLVLGGRGGGSSDEQAKTWSARLLAHTGGRPLVVVIGVGLVVAGGVLAWRGVHQRFEKHLRLGDMTPAQRRWLPWLGTVGHAARGLVLALIGLFLVRAAVRFEPQAAVGVDGALHQVAARSYGPVALGAVALGLGCYGLYSFVEARWRNVMG